MIKKFRIENKDDLNKLIKEFFDLLPKKSQIITLKYEVWTGELYYFILEIVPDNSNQFGFNLTGRETNINQSKQQCYFSTRAAGTLSTIIPWEEEFMLESDNWLSKRIFQTMEEFDEMKSKEPREKTSDDVESLFISVKSIYKQIIKSIGNKPNLSERLLINSLKRGK